MNRRADVEVIINNKRYVLCGYEGEEYLQKIATYINGKITELKQKDFYKTLDTEMKNIFLQINIADDYYKLKKQMRDSESASDAKSNEIFDLKHEVIMLQSKLEAAQKEADALRHENLEEQKKVIRLETELSELRKRNS